MTDIKDITTGLINNDGVWYSASSSAVFYPELGNAFTFQYEDLSFWYKHRNNCIIETIKNFPPIENTIVEIGGGNGYVARALEQNKFSLIMIEPDMTGIQNAQKRDLKNLICTSFDDAGFKNNSLPSVGLFDVIEHIEDDTAFLKKVNLKLHDEGRIYITAPAYNFLFSEEDTHDKHFRRYTLNGLKKKLVSLNYKIEYSTYFFSLLPLPIFLFRTLPTKIGIKRKDTIDVYLNENKGYGSVFEKMLNVVWKREVKIIKKKKSMLFGGSILIVAKKQTE